MAAQYAWETLDALAQTGHPLAMYVEGTADTRNPRRNLPVKAGIGHLAIRSLRAGEQPAHIVPIGVAYPEFHEVVNRKGKVAVQPSRLRGAHAHIGQIIDLTPSDTPATVQRQVADALQEATDRAFDQADPCVYDADNNDITARVFDAAS